MMSRTIKGSKGGGYEYWKRRQHFSQLWGPGSDVKRATNRLHRHIARAATIAGDTEAAEITNLRLRGMTST